jgi:hypothetical protein
MIKEGMRAGWYYRFKDKVLLKEGTREGWNYRFKDKVLFKEEVRGDVYIKRCEKIETYHPFPTTQTARQHKVQCRMDDDDGSGRRQATDDFIDACSTKRSMHAYTCVQSPNLRFTEGCKKKIY